MNKKILFLYSTHEGQTEKIIDHIITGLPTGQFRVDKMNILQGVPENLESYAGVLIASSIRYGKYHPLIRRYIKQHLVQLKRLKSAFFGVNLVARKEDKNTIATNNYTKKLFQALKWHPELAAVFAGAVYYPRYSWIEKRLVQFIMKIMKGDTDITQSVEYTNWQDVDAFRNELIKFFSLNV